MRYLKITTQLLLFFGLSRTAVFAQEQAPAQYGYRILNTYPHDITAFTQGLIYHEGFLFEGTGKNGLSKLSKINLEDNEVLMSQSLSRRYFGEGIEVVGDRIYQLTWTSNMVFVWDKNNFEQLGTHYNATQGWGLAYDGEHLILSDGTSTLQFMDPETFVPQKTVTVTFQGNPLTSINELEYINGEVWANVWQTDFIVRINPEDGVVTSFIDLTGLSNETELGSNEAVLNGIAWDAENERLFVTGKHWADLFEIEIVEP
ncbi:MAG: glutaminyl-peptide cyclotransferase [Gammaproteobacteria bacterium]|nr:glutaminyl-peptide cyclotransferase [Gammaproteobacteria bacterium]